MFPRGIRVLAARLRGVLEHRRAEAEAAEELEAHVALHVADNLRAGMPPAEARRQALLSLGGMEAAKEACRDQRGWPRLEALARDLRQAARQMRRRPGYAAVVVVILALGIGANVAIFTLMDAIMVRPLPVPAAARLVRFNWSSPRRANHGSWSSYGDCALGRATYRRGCTFSYPIFQALAKDHQDFAAMFATGGTEQLQIGAGGRTTIAWGRFASGGFFRALGLEPVLGRLFGPEDDRMGAPPVAVLDYGYWQSRFGGERGVIGRAIDLDGHAVTVIGVAPPSFSGLQPGFEANLWLPLRNEPTVGVVPSWPGPQNYWLEVIGRLRPGRGARQALAEESARFQIAALKGNRPFFTAANSPALGITSAAHGLSSLANQFAQPLDLLLAAVGLVLLLACANIAGLALARGDGRRREMALRLALGAGRGRIVQQLLTESVLLAIGGGVAAIGVAWVAAAALAEFLGQGSPVPLYLAVAPDPRVLLFTAGVAIGVGIVFGLLPALRLADRRLEPAIRSGGAAIAGRPSRRRLGRHGMAGGLVVAQVAIAVVVVAGAGLLLRTLRNLEGRNPGFNTRNLLLFSVDFGQSRLTPAQRASLIPKLKRGLAALPGVTAASYSMTALLDGDSNGGGLRFGPGGKETGSALNLSIGPGYFAAMGIPVRAGREVRRADIAAAGDWPPRVVAVNEALATKYFPHGGALRNTVWTEAGKPMRIIAIVGDTLYQGMRGSMQPTIYYPRQSDHIYFVLRTAAAPAAVTPEVRRFMARAAPELPLFDLHTQREMIARTLLRERLLTELFSLFALMALVLGAIGLFGLLAYEVGRRRREIGLRMALGARAGQVLGSVLAEGLAVAAVGVVVGLGLAAVLTRYLRAMLYGVRPTDPVSLGAAAAVLLAAAGLAAWLPARRAAAVAPWVALRED